ncbi:MAG: hypothetical protein Q8T08_05615, partial [Ignavibacteria bacterium]|nr:hypothetical protein [Ignavibacteria bacterium]
ANFETIESKQLESTDETGSDSAAVVYTDRDKGYYLQDIPLTDEAQVESLKMVEDAFNNLGYIYKESLSDYPRSKEAYIELNERFPESEYQLQAWYALYKMYFDEGSFDQAENYKQLILGKYPNTDYAKVIEDPDYFIEKSKLAGESTLLFEQTFKAYQNEEYYRVLLNANRARTLYPEDVELLPRFDFLRAIAKGRLEVIDSMAVALEQLVKTYPKSSVAPLAASILRNMNKEFNMNIDIPEIEGDSTILLEEASPYNHVADTKFLVMIITSSEKVKTDPLKVRLSDFNNRDFKSAQLMIKSLVLDEARMLVTVGNFNDAASASDYMSAVKQSGYVFGGINVADFVIWPISLTNYPIFYRLKDTAEYEKFWKKNNTIKP